MEKSVKQEEIKGTLYQSLARSNKEIREERGKQLAKRLELTLRRDIEDLRYDKDELETKRENMYDFSPTNSQSLVMGKDVDPRGIMKQESDVSLQIRNINIQLELAEESYFRLFGIKLN